ncbi:MAG: hypothetical protein BAJALOKI2v1_260029 [Promethearchaeota archaeon]|nr:MAG: hypothetical protein BAJALOKI2v1_260029 [Candidatus Lokiarchaeota archaeon]
MFSLENFEEYSSSLSSIIKKLNKYIEKEKISKLPKYIGKLIDLIGDEELHVPITYILSILAENYPQLITEEIFEKVEGFLDSPNDKIKLNTILVLGFYLLEDLDNVSERIVKKFVHFVRAENKDIRNNSYYFINEFANLYPHLICTKKNIIIDALEIEKENPTNLKSLYRYLTHCDNFTFKDIYRLREISLNLISEYFNKDKDLLSSIFSLLKTKFGSLREIELKELRKEEVLERIRNTFLMKKYNYNEISSNKKINFQEYLKKFKENALKDEEIYFYVNYKEEGKKETIFYEIEKDKFEPFFDVNEKIAREEILNEFSKIIDESKIERFMNTLMKIGQLPSGYLSEFYFYPLKFLKSEIMSSYKQKGMVNLKNYNFLPPQFIYDTINEMSRTTQEEFLMDKNEKVFYSLSQLKDHIRSQATKNTSIDLKFFRKRLRDKDFNKLLNNLPKDYLTEYHKGTSWLTNIGKQKIKQEIDNSKVIGYFDLNRISEKLKVGKILLMDIFQTYIDFRSGVWDNDREVFYYSRYLTNKIDEINKISDEEEKRERINSLAKDLNIKREHIINKIDENLQSLGEEIKKKDQISLSRYLDKTGMELKNFMDFIDELDLDYFKKGDQLIFDKKKIEKAKNDIKQLIYQQSKSNDYLSLGNIDIKSDLMKNLIEELQQQKKLKGIFYEEQGEIRFYTERGIKQLMLESTFLFSFHDLFYGKELNEFEISVLKDIFNELREEKKLKGSFDEETLTYSSEEILFAKDYNAYLDEFERTVNHYIKIFNEEFEKIKKILTKKDQTIFPQEIKEIQDIIDLINERYVKWRSGLNAYIRRVNQKVLKDQGYSEKQYRSLSMEPEKKKEIKSFSEDPQVNDLLEGFNQWIKLFNEIELKYPNIIFYQKKLIRNPNDVKAEKKLNELLYSLNLS